MPGWGKLVTGAVLGAAGVLYATNEEFRKALPGKARELPIEIGRRFSAARAAAREASKSRREEILRELESHGGGHAPERAALNTPVVPGETEVPREEVVATPIVPVEEGVVPEGSPARPSEGLRDTDEV